MAESWKRPLQWEKWSSKALRGAVRPTDQLAGRGDAHGPVFPTRGPCLSRARWVSRSQVCQDGRLGFVLAKLYPPWNVMKYYVPLCAKFAHGQLSVQLSVKSEPHIPKRIRAKALPDILNHNCWLVRKQFHRWISKGNAALSWILCWQNPFGCFWWWRGNSYTYRNTGNPVNDHHSQIQL